jgi:5-methylcytosine-specific restriction endonuclease McrA
MSTYLLLWNPAKWAFQDWLLVLANMKQHGFHIDQWSCRSKKPVVGDAVFLKKTGKGLTGIIASGTVIAAPFLNGHWGKGKESLLCRRVLVRFDHLADYTKGEVMPVNDKADFGFVPQASGCALVEDKAASLLSRFHAYVAAPVIAPTVPYPVEKKRENISTRLRWSILDRDFYTCQYCGRSAPTVTLHVDHRISQASWREQHGNLEGVNDPSNLVAACSDCNLGKSDNCSTKSITKENQ